MLPQELIRRVRGGEEVVLRESHWTFPVRALGPVLLVLGSGLVLGFLKGGLWWALPAVGGVATIGVLLWVPLRKVPQLTISQNP